MIMRRFTIGQLMLVIAAVAVEFGLLPTPLAIIAACMTLSLPLIPTPLRWGVLGLSSLGFAGLVLPAITTRTNCTQSGGCASNLRQVSLAVQQYHNDNGCFPPAYVADANGKPLYSWRVLVLPYIDQQALYDAFNFSQPWNGPDNLALSATRIRVFTCPASLALGSETDYLAVVGPGTAFAPGRTTTQGDLSDGPSATIMLAEVARSKVRWAEPIDLDIRTMSLRVNDPAKPGIRSAGHDSPIVSFADSSVRGLGDTVPPKTLKALLTIRGGEKIDLSGLDR